MRFQFSFVGQVENITCLMVLHLEHRNATVLMTHYMATAFRKVLSLFPFALIRICGDRCILRGTSLHIFSREQAYRRRSLSRVQIRLLIQGCHSVNSVPHMILFRLGCPSL